MHTQQFDHLKEGKQVANRCSGSWLWQQERGFRHRINLICAPLSTGPSDGFLPLAWRFKLLWNHKSKETMFFTGEGVEKNRQWPAVMSLEQITSMSAPETGGNLPDRELRVRDIKSQQWRGERERRGGRTSHFLEVNYTHAPRRADALQPITYRGLETFLLYSWFSSFSV